MTETYTLEQLHEDLWHLNHKLKIMEELEYAIDNYWNIKDQFNGTWDEAVALSSGKTGSIVGKGDLEFLFNIPEQCIEIVSIDPSPFMDAADELSPTDRMFVDIEDDPGQILTKTIGSWYGSAADAFEDHLSKYSPTQARQREIISVLINSCISVNEVVTSCHQSVKNLITAASEAADLINSTYESEKKRLDHAVATALVIIIGTALTAGTASGAVAAGATVSTGAANLAQNVYTASTTSKEFKATHSYEFVDELNKNLQYISTALQDMSETIHKEIDQIQSSWPMSDCIIPAPLKPDKFDEGSFYHETNF